MNATRLLDGRLKIRHLVLIDTLSRCGSLVRTADELHVTQPVVTRALHDVERILGAKLYERGPRGIVPTEFGVAFTEHARAVIAQLRLAEEHIGELANAEAGTVTVGMHLAGSNLLLPLAIRCLKETRPKVVVVVREADPDALLADLLAGRVDLTVGRLTPIADGSRVRQRTLYQERMCLVTRADHPAIAQDHRALAALLAYPWILPIAESSLRRELETVFADHELPLPVDRVECTSILTVRNLLLHTDSIAVLPALIAQDDARLHVLPLALPSIRTPVGVTEAVGRRHSPATSALLAALTDAGAEMRKRLNPKEF